MLGEKIRLRREQLGMTQEGLTERLGLDKQTVYRYEANKNQPGYAQLGRIAEELDVTADWLLGLVEEPTRNLKLSDLTPEERRAIGAIRRGELADAMQMLLDIAQGDKKPSVAGMQPAEQG